MNSLAQRNWFNSVSIESVRGFQVSLLLLYDISSFLGLYHGYYEGMYIVLCCYAHFHAHLEVSGRILKKTMLLIDILFNTK